MKPLRSTAPRGHLLHPDTPYTPAVSADIRATFEKARREMARLANVASIKRKSA